MYGLFLRALFTYSLQDIIDAVYFPANYLHGVMKNCAAVLLTQKAKGKILKVLLCSCEEAGYHISAFLTQHGIPCYS